MSDKLEQLFRGWPRRERGPKTFRVGDRVQIRSGPFAAFTGKVEGINQARRMLRVRVEIMGRTTALRLGFDEVEAVSYS